MGGSTIDEDVIEGSGRPSAAWRRRAERASPVILVVVLVAAWEAAVRLLDVPRFLLPAPSEIARLMYDEWALIQMHALQTIGSIWPATRQPSCSRSPCPL